METSAVQIDVVIATFLEELHVVRQLSAHTIRAYQHDLRVLANNLQEFSIALSSVRSTHIRSWVSQLHAKGASPRSLARLLSAWRAFFEWLSIPRSTLGLPEMKVNPVQDIRAPRKTKSLPKALTVEQTIVLMEKAKAEAHPNAGHTSPSPHCWFVQRDHAIVELLYSSGLRLAEILSIDANLTQGYPLTALSWIDWQAGDVHVRGKGAKRRIVPIGSAAMQALNTWYAVWQEQVSNHALSDAPLFFNQYLQRLSPRTVQSRLKTLAQRAGLPMHVHPHMLRHSFASHILQSSHDLRSVQEMLGHASIGSTQIYTSLDYQHLAQAYDLAHPRAKLRK